MKKRWISSSLILTLTILCTLLFSGCGSFDPASIIQPSQSATVSSEELHIYYLDVGQGDAELIILPDDTTILIDSGDRFCKDYITDTLKDYGVEQIDILIASHPHADHIGAMATVVKDFDIGTIYMPRIADDMVPTTVAYETLLETISEKDLTVKTGKAGVSAYHGNGVDLDFLSPSGTDYDNLNNYSIVAKLTYGDTAFLFMGDAETEILNTLLQSGEDLRCDILKLSHHGSRNGTTKAFLTATSPRYGIISCGAENQYGHPHSETLNLLDRAGVKTFRTDESGTICAISDGKTVTVTPKYPSVLPDAA